MGSNYFNVAVINTVHPTLAHQVYAGLGISLPTEARQGIPAKGMDSTERQQNQDKPLLQL